MIIESLSASAGSQLHDMPFTAGVCGRVLAGRTPDRPRSGLTRHLAPLAAPTFRRPVHAHLSRYPARGNFLLALFLAILQFMLLMHCPFYLYDKFYCLTGAIQNSYIGHNCNR